MENKSQLLEELSVLKGKLQPLLEKSTRTQSDVAKISTICDQIEEVDKQIRGTGAMGERNYDLSQTGPSDQQFDRWGQYFQAVAASGMEPGRMLGKLATGRLYPNILNQEVRSTGLEESTPSLGGFLVGEDFATSVFRHAQSTYRLFNRVRKIPIGPNSNKLKFPYVDETDRAAGSRQGGIRAHWKEEGGTKTASKPKFGLLELSLSKLIGLCYASDELLEDATALGSYLYEGFAEEIGFKLDLAVLSGTGAGQPLGMLNAACTVSQAKETGQAATTIVWDNVSKMFSRLWGGSFNNCVWLINQDCLPQLYSMSLPIGTAGAPVFQAANLPAMQLFGRPIIVMEQCETLGTVGDIMLVDPSQYIAITKGGMQTASSIHVQFTTDETVYRFVYRVDGQPLWNAALTPYKGTANTQSPFVTLATRD